MILGQGLIFVNRSQLLILFFGTFGTPNCSLHVSPSLLLGSKWCELSTSLTHTPPLYTTMASLLGYPLGIFSDCFLKFTCICSVFANMKNTFCKIVVSSSYWLQNFWSYFPFIVKCWVLRVQLKQPQTFAKASCPNHEAYSSLAFRICALVKCPWKLGSKEIFAMQLQGSRVCRILQRQ